MIRRLLPQSPTFTRHALVGAFGLVLLSSLALTACSALFSTSDKQCSTDDDCHARGDAFKRTVCSSENTCVTSSLASDGGGSTDPRFACASDPVASPDTSRQVQFSIHYTDQATGAAPTDVSVRLCATTDPTCANPRDTLDGTAAKGDAGAGFVVPTAGTVTGTAEYGFEGFFQLSTGTYAPTYRYTSPPLSADETLFDQVLLRPAEIAGFADAITNKTDSYDTKNHALVFVLAQDCQRNSLAGVHFTVDVEDDSMVPFYVVNTQPSVTETKTDSLGRAGFLNVPAGLATFTAILEETGERIGSTNILVRAGAATTVAVLPSP